jgi:hypothetical protein
LVSSLLVQLVLPIQALQGYWKYLLVQELFPSFDASRKVVPAAALH